MTTSKTTDRLPVLSRELGLIGDRALTEKVIETYLDAMDRYGWTMDDLDRIPFTLMIPGVEVGYLRHVRGVTRMCHGMALAVMEVYGDLIPLDLDVLIAGALLHDIGKLAEFSEGEGGFTRSPSGKLLRHPFSGVAICARHGLPEAVLHLIAVHSREGDGFRRTPEAVILHHADFSNFEPLKG
jgi:putative nucleotidyltransferase with HDIG domain